MTKQSCPAAGLQPRRRPDAGAGIREGGAERTAPGQEPLGAADCSGFLDDPSRLRGFIAGGWLPKLGASSKHKEDRKSTRLNSSHLVISYAVFCLKKKKKQAFTSLIILDLFGCLTHARYVHKLYSPL